MEGLTQYIRSSIHTLGKKRSHRLESNWPKAILENAQYKTGPLSFMGISKAPNCKEIFYCPNSSDYNFGGGDSTVF